MGQKNNIGFSRYLKRRKYTDNANKTTQGLCRGKIPDPCYYDGISFRLINNFIYTVSPVEINKNMVFIAIK